MRLIFGLCCFIIILIVPASAQNFPGKEPLKILALGDSYTIGQSVGFSSRWPVQLADSLEQRGFLVDTVIIVAQTGWTTNNLLNGIESTDLDTDFNFVTLLIGVNNQYQGLDINNYKPQFEELVDKAIEFAKNDTNQVLIVSIPDYAYTPFGQNGNTTSISNEIDQYNNINLGVATAYGIPYLNITPISRRGLDDITLVAGDGLHPSSKMYSLWVEKLLMQAEITEINYTTDDSFYANNKRFIDIHVEHRKLVVQNLHNSDLYMRIYNVNGSFIQVIRIQAHKKEYISVSENLVIYHIIGKDFQLSGIKALH